MSNNFKQYGNILPFIAPGGGVVAGVPIVIQNVVVVPVATAAAGVEFQGRIDGVISGVLKAAGATWTTGQVLYFDTADSTWKTATGATARRAGIAAAPALIAATTGDVKLLNVANAVNVA